MFYLSAVATVKEVVLAHQQKSDGTWNVKIRVTHKRKIAYIPTEHYVIKSQLRKDFSLKDASIVDLINPVLATYRKKISALGGAVELLSVKELATKLSKKEEKGGVDFLKFCELYIDELLSAKKRGSAQNMKTVYNALKDFFGAGEVLASDINSEMLKRFEQFLSAPREITRKQATGQDWTTTSKGATASGLANYMRDLRLLFNAAKERYNDEDIGVFRIPHNPFKKYSMPVKPETRKRSIDIESLLKLRDYQTPEGSRRELARDLFMLSFYLCGMNAVDLYQAKKVNGGRIEYKRAKTSGRRKDGAFMSVAVPKEAKALAAKYIGKLSLRFSSKNTLNSKLSDGLCKIREELGIEGLDFYSARHTFATLARNECRFSKDDVALALNHIDSDRKTTDIYIKPDWTIVDEVQAGVIGLLNKQAD